MNSYLLFQKLLFTVDSSRGKKTGLVRVFMFILGGFFDMAKKLYIAKQVAEMVTDENFTFDLDSDGDPSQDQVG